MKLVIDTSSLISLVRYYLPFDTDAKLHTYVRNQIECGNWVVIDEVLNECKGTSQKLVVTWLDYLVDKDFCKEHDLPVKTEFLAPPAPAKFYRMVDSQFINGSIKNRLDPTEYQNRKTAFLNSADARMIIYCLNEKEANNGSPDDTIMIVTEESETSNDNKAFKKIPAIGKILEIDVVTLPNLFLLESLNGFNFKVKLDE